MTKKSVNYSKQYLLFQLRKLKACTVFSVIFSALGYPALTAAEYLSSHTKAYDPLVISLFVVAVISLLGCAAMSFITPIVSFRHLFTKVEADNILSLPLTANQRFFADAGAVFISFHLPFAISTVIAFALENTICLANDWRCNQDYFYAFALMGIAFMFSALNIAIMTCCGRIVEAILYPVLINIVMPLIIAFGGYIAFKNCIGLSSGIEYEILSSPLFLMWPVGAGISINSFLYIYIIAPVATLIYLIAAFFGYKFRKAENIGKPFVFKPVYLIFSTLTALALITGYTYLTDYATLEGSGIIPSIFTLGLMLLILMLIIELIHSKKIKHILSFAARFGTTLVGGLLLCFGLMLTKGFGAGYYVPDADNVKFITVASTGGYDYGFYNYIYSDEKDVINLVTEEHEKITESMEKWESERGGFNVHYTLNSGRQIYRTYDSGFVSDDFWNRIFTSEGYRVSEIDSLNFDQNLDHGYYKELSTVRLTNRHTAKTYLEFKAEEELLKEITEALEKDLRADTEYGRHDEYSIGVLQMGTYDERLNGNTGRYENFFISYYDFIIYENYTNTIGVLSRYGTVPKAEESLEDSTINGNVYTLVRRRLDRVDDSFTDLMWNETCEAVFITEEEFKELVQHDAEYINPSDDGYVYSVSKGISNFISLGYEEYEGYDYKQMLNDIGIYYDNYEFFEDADSLYNTGSYRSYYINEEYNSRCAEIFNGRTAFDKFYSQSVN